MLKKYLYIFLISMVPLIELRGAIPVSQGFQLPLLQSYIVCVIGHKCNWKYASGSCYLSFCKKSP